MPEALHERSSYGKSRPGIVLGVLRRRPRRAARRRGAGARAAAGAAERAQPEGLASGENGNVNVWNCAAALAYVARGKI